MSAALANLTTPPPKPTAKELQEGEKLRSPAREDVLRKKEIWEKQFSPLNTQLKVPSSVTSPFPSLFANEMSWYKTNIQVTPLQIRTHIQEFKEAYEIAYKNYNDAVKELLLKTEPPLAKEIVSKWPDVQQKSLFEKAVQGKISAAQTKANLEKAKENEKDIFTVAWEAIVSSLSYFKIVFYIFLAFAVASFSASESLWQPKTYQMLNYVYALVFAPVFIVYYTYRLIKYRVFGGTPIRMEALIYPNFPYDPKPAEQITFLELLFGYMTTPELLDWIKSKKEQDLEAKTEYLNSDFLDRFKQAKEESRKLE